ncbi:acyl-CoA reductase [Cochleicola gelatinilyticus]|uniref:Acyl-CoA reductase n=1 Tax=Cochleicola gelatinilyticus TaxID=1763537 RepID=A0A167H1P6_9FLAO|nr:acyl-CoA reductase [Cochleicola gelatinilyticus]OAB78119.1 acyl-CoA reductase [Cochleicola gelatinilyticus]
MDLQQRINAFTALGQFLSQFSSEKTLKNDAIQGNDLFFERMSQQLDTAVHHNGWFTRENIQFALKSWGKALSEENIKKWLSKYPIPKKTNLKTIAIIMAGNIPLVGFHDFLSVLITGNTALVKLSSNDSQLLPLISEYLIGIEPSFKQHIKITNKKLENFDAVIATGSDNTARYFDYYFGKYPHIIRKNRNAVAVLTGKETPEQLNALANDVFRYFGLGCRNVSKVFLPEDYNFDPLFNGMFSWKHMINNNKYINNYDYNKAVYLMSNLDLLDNEFLLLKEDSGYSSPISVLFYEKYKDLSEIKQKLKSEAEHIQVIVSDSGIKEEVPFGAAQKPQLWDYADGVDTVDFLLKLP